MPSSTVCWGVEIGAYAVKALKLEADGEEAKVVDFAIIPHKKPLSTPGIDPNDIVRVSLGELVSQYDVAEGGATVALSVPGHSAFARFAKLPPVEPKKVPDIVKFEAVQQIPFPLEQVEWDYQTFANEDSPDIEVGIFAITRERILERLALYEDAGIVPDCVTLSPVAAFNALAHDLVFTEKSPGTIVLDIGTTSTDLVIAEAGRVWIRTFPIGGHHFTEALVNSFQLSYAKAEKLKKEAESSKHARHIFQAMRPIFGDLAQDVQRSIGYYQTLHKDAKLERLIGLGSTFRLPGIRKYLKQQVGLDVFRLEQFKRLNVDGPRAGELQASAMNLATAYGLSLQGLGMASLEANLMPAAVLKAAMWDRKVKWFGVAAGVAVAASGAMFIRPFLDSQAVAAERLPGVVTEVVGQGQSLRSAALDVTSAAIDNAEAAAMLGLLESRDVYGHMTRDLAEMMRFAQDRSESEGPVFSLERYQTQHRSGRGTDQQDMGIGEPQIDDGPRIEVVLRVTTTDEDPRRLAFRTLDRWLRDNAEREGVPYRIVVPETPSRLVGTREATAGERRQPTFRGPGMMDRPQVRGPGFGPPGGVGEIGAGSGRDIPTGRGEEEPEEEMTASAAREQIQQVAPLPRPEEVEGEERSTVEVRWEVVLSPRAANGGGM